MNVLLNLKYKFKSSYYTSYSLVYSAKITKITSLGVENYVFKSVIFAPLVVTVMFERETYTVVEGQTVELCLLAEGNVDFPFSVSANTRDITANGQSYLISKIFFLSFSFFFFHL